MSKRYWIHPTPDRDRSNTVGGPFESATAADRCIKSLEEETGNAYYRTRYRDA